MTKYRLLMKQNTDIFRRLGTQIVYTISIPMFFFVFILLYSPFDCKDFLSSVPVRIDLPFILLADAVAFCAIMLMLLIPTLFIAKVDPAKTAKTE